MTKEKERRPPAPRDRFYRPPRPCDVSYWRLATARWRRWPDFLIIGAQRGGTTTLYEYLSRHPGVAPATEKEIHFFDFQFERGVDWYRGHFPLRLASGKITGEASPFYLFHPRVPKMVRTLLPTVKLIVLLRDPVERAHSHYRFQKKSKIERLATFEEALEAEPERLGDDLEKMRQQDDFYSYNLQHYSYLARGLYQPQVEAWLQCFPREQLLLLSSEELYSQPASLYSKVDAFLGLRQSRQPDSESIHLNREPGDPMRKSTREWLVNYYAPHNAALFQLLGKRFEWP